MRIQCVCTSPLNFHTDGFPQAFTKRERITSNPQYSGAGASSGSGIQAPTKKTTEWYLEPWAHNGVQSTSSYRDKNKQRRSAAGWAINKNIRLVRNQYFI
jgi:hypothetical protein